jgi:hypothetical protein
MEASGMNLQELFFNSLVQLEYEKRIPRNPFKCRRNSYRYACDSFGQLKQDFLDFIRMIQQ